RRRRRRRDGRSEVTDALAVHVALEEDASRRHLRIGEKLVGSEHRFEAAVLLGGDRLPFCARLRGERARERLPQRGSMRTGDERVLPSFDARGTRELLEKLGLERA